MHEIRVLDGFNRFKKRDMNNANMFNRMGVGANAGTDTMQGFNRILQGYKRGTKQDLEDWEFLVNIEHPDVMQGFENFVSQGDEPLNGKKRQERRAAKEQKKQQKQQQKSENKAGRAQRKDKRQERQQAAKDRRQDKKNIRVARKEERLLKKESKREERAADKQARRARKDQRIADRKDVRMERQQTRRERTGKFADTLRDLGQNIGGGLLSNLVGGDGVFQDMTFSDIPSQMFPGQFEDLITTFQDMPAEDALQMRDQLVEDAAENAGGAAGAGEGGSSMMMPLLIGGGALLLLSGNKKKRKK